MKCRQEKSTQEPPGNAASTVRTVEESTEVLLRKSGTSEEKAQQICVAVRMDDNPGSTEKDTVNGRVPVCNAIVQQGGTRVRCTRHNAFERRHARVGFSFEQEGRQEPDRTWKREIRW